MILIGYIVLTRVCELQQAMRDRSFGDLGSRW